MKVALRTQPDAGYLAIRAYAVARRNWLLLLVYLIFGLAALGPEVVSENI